MKYNYLMAARRQETTSWEDSVTDLIGWLRDGLQTGRPEEYDQLAELSAAGIYIVYLSGAPVYVGKTSRSGKIRLRELVTDRRSHTFNNKLVREELSKKLNVVLKTLGPKKEAELITNGRISKNELAALQDKINSRIRQYYRFKFLPAPPDKLSQYEHFAIAVLNPAAND